MKPVSILFGLLAIANLITALYVLHTQPFRTTAVNDKVFFTQMGVGLICAALFLYTQRQIKQPRNDQGQTPKA